MRGFIIHLHCGAGRRLATRAASLPAYFPQFDELVSERFVITDPVEAIRYAGRTAERACQRIWPTTPDSLSVRSTPWSISHCRRLTADGL
ncbi:hypothetical protein ACFPIJ_33050 [Dactylosporangium cerinum]|uniref:Uncharacterized protein n=1 Tax=Dactylosporangium cerinum TaxID=1434730 RepID=A0ABV9W5M0_9ACTN